MDNNFHTRVVLLVQELDEDGNVTDTPSEQVLGDFPNDQDEEYSGKQSDDLFNEIVSRTNRV